MSRNLYPSGKRPDSMAVGQKEALAKWRCQDDLVRQALELLTDFAFLCWQQIELSASVANELSALLPDETGVEGVARSTCFTRR